MSQIFYKLRRDTNRVKNVEIHRCIDDGYGLIQIFTEKIRIPPKKLWRVCTCRAYVYLLCTPVGYVDCLLQVLNAKCSVVSFKKNPELLMNIKYTNLLSN